MKHLTLIILFLSFPLILAAQPKTQKVLQVIDGGHLILENGEKVALLGVEAPSFPKPKTEKDGKTEPNHSIGESWARQSKAFVEGMVLNRPVWLEYDQERKNAEGETLAYAFFKLEDTQNLGSGGQKVYLTAGTYMLNRLVLTYGFASSGSSYPFKYRAEFHTLMTNARQQQVGLWQNNF